MLHRFDIFLLDRVYQPICDALYDRIGDNIAIARATLIQAIGLTVCIAVLHAWTYPRWFMLLLSSDLLVISALGFFYTVLGRASTHTGPNVMRFMLFYLRIICLFYMVFEGPMLRVLLPILSDGYPNIPDAVLTTMRDLIFVSVLYFASCHNLPPVKRARRRIWSPAYS